jgi:phosphonate transport system ATP-binding protein
MPISSPPLSPIFELEAVTQRFGDTAALVEVSLRIHAGERVALMGPSGAGKSTLLGLLNGSLSPTRGLARVLGKDLGRLTPGARRRVQAQIGTVYQQYHLVDNLAVVHNVNAGHLGRWPLWKALLSLAWPQEVEAARQALAQVGIPEKLYARTDSLSGGQQQRVAIARVLTQNPHAILADEPVSSLDPERGREIMDLLRDLSAHSGRALVASLHAVEYVSTHFQRAIGLRHGRVVFDGPVSELTAARIEMLYAL